jgi:DNA-binding IclR family transcriptional regulator
MNVKANKSASTSLGKALEILDLFSMETPLLQIEDMALALGFTRSTAYRYLKELCDAGLLVSLSGGSYALGPRIIELERLLELTDPLYTAGKSVLAKLDQDDKVFLLHNLYGEKVLCIYKQGPDTVRHNGRSIIVRRARGLPFPLFQGAASLAMLAYLSPHRIRQTYLHSSGEIAAAGLGKTWEEFRSSLAAIRRSGFATSKGQITPLLGGIAVPILHPDDKRVIGSLAQTVPAREMGEEIVNEAVERLWFASERIANAYLKASRL